ncbi:Uncharacterised protein [Leminorella grimontii]|nr:Uncharacterised protein [Leminorella grimontii]
MDNEVKKELFPYWIRLVIIFFSRLDRKSMRAVLY